MLVQIQWLKLRHQIFAINLVLEKRVLKDNAGGKALSMYME